MSLTRKEALPFTGLSLDSCCHAHERDENETDGGRSTKRPRAWLDCLAWPTSYVRRRSRLKTQSIVHRVQLSPKNVRRSKRDRCNCRGGPPWPPQSAPFFNPGAATEGRPYNCQVSLFHLEAPRRRPTARSAGGRVGAHPPPHPGRRKRTSRELRDSRVLIHDLRRRE
jgi:hypothetical protein